MFRYPKHPRVAGARVLIELEKQYKIWFPTATDKAFSERVFESWKPSDAPKGDEICELIISRTKLPQLSEEMFRELLRQSPSADTLEPRILVHMVLAVVSAVFAMEAIYAEKDGAVEIAWQSASTACYFLEALIREGTTAILEERVIQRLTRKAAAIRHADNRKKTKTLLNWYAANREKYPSKNRAAEVAAELFGMKRKTVRNTLVGK